MRPIVSENEIDTSVIKCTKEPDFGESYNVIRKLEDREYDIRIRYDRDGTRHAGLGDNMLQSILEVGNT